MRFVMSLSKLKEILRELIKQELEEASYTSNIPGYQTPYAFTDPKKDKKKKKKQATAGGYKLAEIYYRDLKNDESRSPKQKVWHAVREVRDSLVHLEKTLNHTIRLKNELNIDSRTYYKYAHNGLTKIGEKLVRLANKIGQLK